MSSSSRTRGPTRPPRATHKPAGGAHGYLDSNPGRRGGGGDRAARHNGRRARDKRSRRPRRRRTAWPRWRSGGWRSRTPPPNGLRKTRLVSPTRSPRRAGSGSSGVSPESPPRDEERETARRRRLSRRSRGRTWGEQRVGWRAAAIRDLSIKRLVAATASRPVTETRALYSWPTSAAAAAFSRASAIRRAASGSARPSSSANSRSSVATGTSVSNLRYSHAAKRTSSGGPTERGKENARPLWQGTGGLKNFGVGTGRRPDRCRCYLRVGTAQATKGSKPVPTSASRRSVMRLRATSCG